MAIDETIQTGAPEPTTADAVRGLIDLAKLGFATPTVESDRAVIQVASLSGLTTQNIINMLKTDQGTEALSNNVDLLKNADIALQIAGIPTGIIEQGLNTQALSQNADFQQIAHYVYDAEHGEGAWAARVRGEIEDTLWREVSDEEYGARNALHAIAGEHGIQSEEFVNASIEYHAQFPQHSERGPNASIRTVEYSLNQANRSVRDAERRLEEIRNDADLSPEDKVRQVEFAQRDLDIQTEKRDRYATRWGREFVKPLRDNETAIKLAETLFERLSHTGEFLAKSEAEYDRLATTDTPPRPTWAEHTATLLAEYDSALFHFPWETRPDPAALLTEWGKGRIDQKMGLKPFDFSKMEEFGLDTGIFEASDSQNQHEDTAQGDIAGRFGRAWLHAAEIVYNGKNDTPWAEHLNTELSATLDNAASPAEKAAAEELIKIATEHGATSPEFMEATQKFIADHPESATGQKILQLNTDLAKEGEWALRWQDGNLGSALTTEWTRSEEFQASIRYLVRLDEYTRYEWGNDFWQDMGVGVLDPTQIVSLAATVGITAYTGGTGSAPAIATTQAARAGLFKLLSGVTKEGLIRGAKTGIVLNAIEGGATEGFIENSNQNLELGLTVRSEKDMTSILMRTGTGAVMGAGLGAVFGSGSHVGSKVMSNFFENTNIGNGIRVKVTEASSATTDFIMLRPRITDSAPDAPQLGPTIAAAAELDTPKVIVASVEAPATLVEPPASAVTNNATPIVDAAPVNRVAPETLDAPVVETVVTPDAVNNAPPIVAIIEAPEVTPAAPIRTAPIQAATHPLGILSGFRLPGLRTSEPVFAPMLTDGFGGGRVFSPADSGGGTPPVSTVTSGPRHRVNGKHVNSLINTLRDTEVALLRNETLDSSTAYADALKAVEDAMNNNAEYSPGSQTRLQNAHEGVTNKQDVEEPKVETTVETPVETDAAKISREARELYQSQLNEDFKELDESLQALIDGTPNDKTATLIARKISTFREMVADQRDVIPLNSSLSPEDKNLAQTFVLSVRQKIRTLENRVNDDFAVKLDEIETYAEDALKTAEEAALRVAAEAAQKAKQASTEALGRTVDRVEAANEDLTNGLTAVLADIGAKSEVDARNLISAFYKELEAIKNTERGHIDATDQSDFDSALTAHDFASTEELAIQKTLTEINDTPPDTGDTSGNWYKGYDSNYGAKAYTPAETASATRNIGDESPNTPFRRVRKDVDPLKDASKDPILGDGTFRTLADFERGFKEATKNYTDAIQAASKLTDPTAKADAINEAVNNYNLTLDKMDAATDHLDTPWNEGGEPADKMLGRDGVILRNTVRLDYKGKLSKQPPHITHLQKIATQESIVDARQLAEKLRAMAVENDGALEIESFLVGVSERVNTIHSARGQFDSLLSRGWEVLGWNNKGLKGRAKRVLDEKEVPRYTDGPHKGKYKLGYTNRREQLRFGHELAEGSHSFTRGERSPEALHVNMENLNSIISEIISIINKDGDPLETRMVVAAGKAKKAIHNGQFQDLLYVLQRDSWKLEATQEGKPTTPFVNFDAFLKTLRDEMGDDLTAYDLGVLKRFELEGKLSSDNPHQNLSADEQKFFDAVRYSGRAVRGRAAMADQATDLMNGRYSQSSKDTQKHSDAGATAAGSAFNRGFYDRFWTYSVRLKDIDHDAVDAAKIEKPTAWRIPFKEGDDQKGGFNTWFYVIPKPGTLMRMADRWTSPVGYIMTRLRTATDNESFSVNYPKTKVFLTSKPVHVGLNAAWYATAATTIAAGGPAFPLYMPIPLAIKEASGAATLLLPGDDAYWGAFSNTGPTVEAADAADSPSTDDDAPADIAIASSNEAIKIRQWAEQHRDDAALKLPNYTFSSEDDAYIESIVLRAAHLLKNKPADYPNVRWSTVSNNNDFTEVWAAARTEINAGLRNDGIKASAMKAYAELTGRDATFNFASDTSIHFNKVVGWLQADTTNIAPIDPATLLVVDPWATDSAAFKSAVERLEDSLSPAAVNARIEAALAGFAADRGVAVTALTEAEKEAATVLANTLKNPATGVFYTADELKGSADANKTLRAGALTSATAIIEQRAVEAARQARIQVALIGYANDKGSGLAGLTAAERQAATAMIETKDASNVLHTESYLSGIAGRVKRQDILTSVTKALNTPAPGSTADSNFAVTGQEAIQSGLNVLNTVTDIDGDGYSALIQTDWGRSISGGLQQAGGAINNLWGNLNKTEGGRDTIGIGAGIAGALLLPSIARQIPFLKFFANIPVVGGLLFAVLGFFLAAKSVNGLYKNGSLFGDSEDGDTDTGSETQGSGGYIDASAVGHKIRTQPHDGGLPEIISIEGDFDGDPATLEVLHFFDLDRDGQYAAQLARPGEGISFAAPEMISGSDLQGTLEFIDNITRAKATARANMDIKIEAVGNTGDPAIMKLTINGQDYNLNHKLENPLDNPYLSQTLETQ